MSKLRKMSAVVIGIALSTPAIGLAMTIECRDLAFGQHLGKLSIVVDQDRASVSADAGQLLGRYAFEVLQKSPDLIVLHGRQSTLPWRSPVVVLRIALEPTHEWGHGRLAGSPDVDHTAGAIEWACRQVK